VELARRNAVRNFAESQDTDRSEPIGQKLDVRKLQWGFLEAADYFGAADVVVGSDLTYNSGTWKVLAETISTMLKPQGFMLYVAVGHAGFGVQGEMAGFLSVAEGEGVVELQKYPDRWPLGNADNGISPSECATQYLLQKLMTREEQLVFKSTGGARVFILGKKQRNKRI